jgi:alcohol dehydrogenase class IV
LADNVIYGSQAFGKLKNLISPYKNALLVTGKRSFKISGASKYFDAIGEDLKITYIHYSGKALPVEDVQEIYSSLTHIHGIDLIIAVGGGR